MKTAQKEVPASLSRKIDGEMITHRYTMINGIRYHYAEAGKGPLVVLLHGAFEFWYSWRDQLTTLAQAGYHAVAPDLRGHGETEATPDVEDYSLFQHAKDVRALIEQLGGRAALVGHDWGSNLTWLMALLYPEAVGPVAVLSVPFYPEPRDPEQMKNFFKDKFSFMGYFQKPGAAEEEFNQDPQRFFRLFLYGFSGDAPAGTVDKLFASKPVDAKLLDGFPEPEELPDWLSQADIGQYANAYRKSGLTGTLNFYRNVEHDHPLLVEAYRKKIEQPVLFVGGGEEAAVKYGDMNAMRRSLPNLRDIVIYSDCGHFIQEERKREFNKALTRFLDHETHEGTTSETEAIRSMQHEFDQAELHADREILHRLLADEFQGIGPKGFVLDKSQWIARHDMCSYQKLRTSELTIHEYGNTAIVTELQRNEATFKDHPVNLTVRATHVWVKDGPDRHLVSLQFSPAESPAEDQKTTVNDGKQQH